MKRVFRWGPLPRIGRTVLRVWPTRLGGALLWLPPFFVLTALLMLGFVVEEEQLLHGVSVFWTTMGLGSLAFTDIVRRRTRRRWRAARREFGERSVAALVALSIHRFTVMIEVFHLISIGVGFSTLLVDATNALRIMLSRDALVSGQVILFMLALSVFLGDELVKRRMKTNKVSVTQVDDSEGGSWWKRMLR